MNYQALQQMFMEWAPKIAIAVLILIVAHFAAKAVKWAIAKGDDRIPFLSRRDSGQPGGVKPTVDVGERIGEVGYWVVWLLGLIAALNQLDQDAIAQPLNNMVDGFVRYVPQVVGAALIFFIGFVLATVARRMVEAAAMAAEVDRRLVEAGLTHMPRGPGLARLLGIREVRVHRVGRQKDHARWCSPDVHGVKKHHVIHADKVRGHHGPLRVESSDGDLGLTGFLQALGQLKADGVVLLLGVANANPSDPVLEPGHPLERRRVHQMSSPSRLICA